MAKNNEFNARITHKHDTEENWLKATGFSPLEGELIIYDKDDTHPIERFKIGDGVTNVNDLPFYTNSDSYFGICNTAVNEPAKIVTLTNSDNFELKDNLAITVRFTYGLRTFKREDGEISLNINNTGDKLLYVGGVDSTGIYDNENYLLQYNGFLNLYYNKNYDCYTVSGVEYVPWSDQALYAMNAFIAEETLPVMNTQAFGTCETEASKAIKEIVIEPNFSFSSLTTEDYINNFVLQDGTRLSIRFYQGLRILNGTPLYFKINEKQYDVYYNGIDDFSCFNGATYIIWNVGILSFIYDESMEAFILDGGTEYMQVLNEFMNGLDENGYDLPSDFIDEVIANKTNIENLSSHVKTNKLTTTSLESTDNTLIEPLKVRDNRIDIFKTTQNYGTDNQVAGSNVVIKKDNSIKIDNISIELTDTAPLDAHKVITDDGSDGGLQVGSTLKIQDGLIKLGYNASDDSYNSYIECGQKDDDNDSVQELVIATKNNKQGVRISDNSKIVSIFANQIKLAYDGSNVDNSDNAAIDTRANDVSNGIKLRARVNNANGGRNNIVIEENEVRICGDINLKDVSTNCTGLYTDITQEELDFIEGNLQNTLIDLKRINVPIADWNTQDENADTYFSGYVSMKEMVKDVNDVWCSSLGRYGYYAGLHDLATYAVPIDGWETQDTSHDWYFSGYDNMYQLSSDCAGIFMGMLGSDNQWAGIGEVIQAVEDLEYQIGDFIFDSTDYISTSEISNKFDEVDEKIVAMTNEEIDAICTDFDLSSNVLTLSNEIDNLIG